MATAKHRARSDVHRAKMKSTGLHPLATIARSFLCSAIEPEALCFEGQVLHALDDLFSPLLVGLAIPRDCACRLLRRLLVLLRPSAFLPSRLVRGYCPPALLPSVPRRRVRGAVRGRALRGGWPRRAVLLRPRLTTKPLLDPSTP